MGVGELEDSGEKRKVGEGYREKRKKSIILRGSERGNLELREKWKDEKEKAVVLNGGPLLVQGKPLAGRTGLFTGCVHRFDDRGLNIGGGDPRPVGDAIGRTCGRGRFDVANSYAYPIQYMSRRIIQVNYDGELHKHPQLEADLTAVREIYGPNAVSLREYGAIDDVDIDLHIDVSFLDEEIAVAWDVIRTEPIIVRLHCSLTQYLNGPVPTVDVFQISTKERFGLGHQLKKIMQTFVTQQWKNSKEKSNCTHNKKVSEKKVKSPLHIFSTLRRSPSYPPPGCGKNKSKLKSEQDGISKTHKLLRRTCSSTVKAEDVCATKSHRTFGHSLSSDPRAEQTMAIKSHKLLNRSCAATVKQEECITLKPQKLLSRSCSGDPRCEHNSTLKPHKLLSRSYSSNLRMEELDGLKNHKLLSKSYSSAPKSSKMEFFKEPTIAEGRRLSLTSGLIGILTPSSSSPSQAAPNYGAKCIPIRDNGFLVQTIEFAEQRIPVLNEYCVVCDEPHVFQNGPMLRPTVCERELCVFAFQTLGVMNEAADEIATGAQVVDLLVSMCRSALESPRKVVIFEPYPSVVDPNDPQMLAFNPRKKNYDRVMKALDSITSIREMTQQLKFMHTPHQFLLLSSPPAKESNFRAAKNLYGSTFAFHGSHIENWHSILRNGLVVASNTRLQLHGAMFGIGIYLSPLSSISFGYSGMNKKQQKVSAKDEPASNSKGSNALQDFSLMIPSREWKLPSLKPYRSLEIYVDLRGSEKAKAICTKALCAYGALAFPAP
ncbi:Poly [ADP-ribose] polymerase 8 [Chelonia mydas]|uniref:Poly [ADP-ribose] polymerase n=1 Tax=Chelonia mydas TaxID=8469 RepID=M7C2K9_CHEMY|nr:Poly [ADP-ribose] polymerase 8 [Chelonia mydas]